MYIFIELFLDRHLGWRSLDPTLDISSDFVKKKKEKHSASFFLLLHLFNLKTTGYHGLQKVK